MAEQTYKDRILVIDLDENERAMLVEAALKPFGYAVEAAEDGGTALAIVLDRPPDAILLDLNIEGLSGQDFLAALNAQSIDVPVIVLADRGRESAALDAFRLGAKDYVVRPFREAEIIQVAERALTEVRIRREREALVGEVHRAAEEAERHLRELKTLMGIGKSVTALAQPAETFDRVLRAALQLARAESAGLFVRDPGTNQLIVRAGHNMSRNLLELMGQPIDDALAALVMNSQESYLGSGSGLEKFRPAQQGAAAVIYAPLVFQGQAIGVLWVANTRLEFEPHLKDIMTSLADYAAIAVANARLYSAMEKRSEQLQQQLEASVPADEEALFDTAEISMEAVGAPMGGLGAEELAREIRHPLTELLGNMNMFRTGEMGPLPAGLQAAVDVMHRQLDALVRSIDEFSPPDSSGI